VKVRRRDGNSAAATLGHRNLQPTRIIPDTARRHSRNRAGCERKENASVIYGEPETSRFLAAVQRLKREQRKRERLTREAKQRVRQTLRKMRTS
jgi:hypothetical protein